jgi:hypothetical protein
MPKIYLNDVTGQLSEPLNGSVTEWYTLEKERPVPHKYKLQCIKCEIKWCSKTPTGNCWSCGEEKRDPWFSLREKK